MDPYYYLNENDGDLERSIGQSVLDGKCWSIDVWIVAWRNYKDNAIQYDDLIE